MLGALKMKRFSAHPILNADFQLKPAVRWGRHYDPHFVESETERREST